MKVKHHIFITSLIGIHLLFFVIKIIIGDFFIVDSYEYYQLAENIVNTFEFYCGDLQTQIEESNYTRRPPIYSLFIIITSGFLKSTIAILLFQNLLSIISLLWIKQIFEENSFKINQLWFFIFIGTSINQFVYTNLVMSEILLQFFIILLLYTLHKLFKNPSWKHLIFFQLIIILLFLTKPVFYLFIIPNIIITLLICRKTKIKYGFLSSVIPLLVFLLYCHWNYNRTGSYDFSSLQNSNLLEWNLKYFHQHKYGPEKALAITSSVLSEASKIQEYPKRQHYIRNQSIKYLKQDLIGYGIFHGKGCLRMFIDPGRFDLFKFFNIQLENPEKGILHYLNNGGLKRAFKFLKSQPIFLVLSFFVILLLNLIKGVGFVWFWIKNYRKTNFVIVTTLFLILYVVALTGPLGASRFFVPVLPAYLVFSVLGCSDLLATLKNFYMDKKKWGLGSNTSKPV